MRRKIQAIWKIIFCKQYMAVTRNKKDLLNYDFTFSHDEVKRYSAFILAYLQETDNAVNEAQEIINSK
jgi:hypothetical protein